MNQIIITFKDNSDFTIVAPNQVNQFWHDLKAITTDNANEIAIPIGVFIENKDKPNFQEKFHNVIRIRTSQLDVFAYLLWRIRPFDNTISEIFKEAYSEFREKIEQ